MVILSVTNGYSLANTVMWSIVFLKRCNNRAKAVFNRYSLAISGLWNVCDLTFIFITIPCYFSFNNYDELFFPFTDFVCSFNAV